MTQTFDLRKLELTGEATSVAENVAQQVTYASSRTHLLLLIPAVYLNLATDHSRFLAIRAGALRTRKVEAGGGKRLGPHVAGGDRRLVDLQVTLQTEVRG